MSKYTKDLVDELAVATLPEAVELVYAGINSKIIILGSIEDCATDKENIAILRDFMAKSSTMCDIIPTITDENDIKLLFFYKDIFKRVNIKVNTGMNRLGLEPYSIEKVFIQLQELGFIVDSVFSHLYNAENLSDSLEQLKTFNDCTNFLSSGIKRHITASGATFLPYEFYLDMVRVGVATYGYSNLTKPIAKLHSTIAKVFFVKSGSHISYGDFIATKDMKIAVIRAGYADGIRRKVDPNINNYFVDINNTLCPIVGQVCMDMTIVDVSFAPLYGDDKVYFVSDKVSAKDIAVLQNTNVYEILTGFKGRLRREYEV